MSKIQILRGGKKKRDECKRYEKEIQTSISPLDLQLMEIFLVVSIMDPAGEKRGSFPGWIEFGREQGGELRGRLTYTS